VYLQQQGVHFSQSLLMDAAASVVRTLDYESYALNMLDC
jgi:hypothetical protein